MISCALGGKINRSCFKICIRYVTRVRKIPAVVYPLVSAMYHSVMNMYQNSREFFVWLLTPEQLISPKLSLGLFWSVFSSVFSIFSFRYQSSKFTQISNYPTTTPNILQKTFGQFGFIGFLIYHRVHLSNM